MTNLEPHDAHGESPQSILPGGGWKQEAAVVLFIFRRPETTAKVFQAISKAKPKKLFIIANSPRKNYPGEEEACRQTRDLVEKINWDCDVLRNYSDVHWSLNERRVSGLNWVFSKVDEAIILEDDCLPAPSFFRFAEEMLERYRDCPSVFSVCGANFIPMKDKNSYYFSRYFTVWGWASWKRAWERFPGLEPKAIQRAFPFTELTTQINAICKTRSILRDSLQMFHLLLQGKYVGWDFIWGLSGFKNEGFCVIPSRNLISNIGISQTSHAPVLRTFMRPLDSLEFPLVHPTSIERNETQDLLLEGFSPPSFAHSLKLKIKLLLPSDIYSKIRKIKAKFKMG